MFKTVEWKFASLSYLNSLSVFSRSGFDRSSLIGSVFRHLDGDDGLFRILPPHLQDAHYGGHEKLGHGIGYKYAHDYPNHYVHQQYLPTEIQGEHFYELSEMGYEKTLKEYQTKIKSQS